MARLLFVDHSNYDARGKRVVCVDGNKKEGFTENTIYESSELDNEAINKLCGLTNSDIMAIRDWLDEAGGRLL